MPSLDDPRIQFNVPIDTMKLLVMFRRAEITRDPLAQARPFIVKLWLAIVLWLGANTVALAICNLVWTCWIQRVKSLSSKQQSRNQNDLPSICNESGGFLDILTNSIFSPLSLMSNVGVDNPLQEQSSLRITVLTASTTAALIVVAYGAQLLTFLTVEIQTIGTAGELVKSSYRFSSYDHEIVERLFKVSLVHSSI